MTEAKTQQQLPEETTSEEIKYKGVRKRKWGKWVSEIRLPNSRDRIWLGSHDKPEKAARAFDAAQFCLRGPHANFNFPDSPPDIAGGHRFNAQEIQAAAAKFASSCDGRGTPESDREHSEVTAHAVGGGGAIDWPVLDVSDTFDIGSDFDDYFGFENIIMGRNVLFPMGDIEEELVHGGGDFSHQSNFLWNFDNY